MVLLEYMFKGNIVSHSPPIPTSSISPYPLVEPAHDQARPQASASEAKTPIETGVLAELREQITPTKVGAAAAVAAAGIAALLVGRRIAQNSREDAKPKAGNKAKRGGSDRRTVAKGEGYEVSYFANKHRISLQQARDLISTIGNDRVKLNAAASKIASQRRQRS